MANLHRGEIAAFICGAERRLRLTLGALDAEGRGVLTQLECDVRHASTLAHPGDGDQTVLVRSYRVSQTNPKVPPCSPSSFPIPLRSWAPSPR